jgi:hypothetical protein
MIFILLLTELSLSLNVSHYKFVKLRKCSEVNRTVWCRCN